jgi:hypothetical protein
MIAQPREHWFHNKRFRAVWMSRGYWALYDAATVSDADVRAGKRPQCIGGGSLAHVRALIKQQEDYDWLARERDTLARENADLRARAARLQAFVGKLKGGLKEHLDG